uniref:Putative secreted protein n=1 Tax=Ixodes scapularis TaxID=6945 RepID=A0A4D5RX22_IXOSC
MHVACLDVLLWNMLDLCFIYFFFSVLGKKKFSAKLRGVDLNAVGIHSFIDHPCSKRQHTHLLLSKALGRSTTGSPHA